MPRRWTHLISLAVLAGMTRIYRLGAKSLWLDELGQVLVAKGDLPAVIEGVSQHLSPPLDYLILHGFMALGDSEVVVRLPAALFGIAAVASVYLLASELFDAQVALLSGLLLALSQFHIHHSQEARMYSLFLLLAVLSVAFFVRYVRRAGRWALPIAILHR